MRRLEIALRSNRRHGFRPGGARSVPELRGAVRPDGCTPLLPQILSRSPRTRCRWRRTYSPPHPPRGNARRGRKSLPRARRVRTFPRTGARDGFETRYGDIFYADGPASFREAPEPGAHPVRDGRNVARCGSPSCRGAKLQVGPRRGLLPLKEIDVGHDARVDIQFAERLRGLLQERVDAWVVPRPSRD